MITLVKNFTRKEIPIKWLEFSDGALSCKILEPLNPENSYTLVVSPTTPVKCILEELWTICNAIEHAGIYIDDVTLDMKYLPYARAERKFEDGNPVPLQWFLYVLNTLKFTQLIIADPHNDAYKDFYKGKVNVISQLDALLESMSDNEDTYDYIVAPDKGASEKALHVVNYCKAHHRVELLQATKIRDTSTGHIISTVIPDIDLTGCKCLIVDDLMDRGGTFVPLAKKLKEAGASQVDLYVTHMIATKGLDLFKDLVDNIYCYQIVQEYITRTDILNFNKRNGENT